MGMDTLTATTSAATPDAAGPIAQRLLTWVTIGGLILGTYGTFHAVTTLTFGTNPADRPFHVATYDSIHRLAVTTVFASQVLQLVGSTALWRRRLLGRTLLITYAVVYLAGLILVQTMRGIDAASLPDTLTSQKAMVALGEMHLMVYGSVFPMILLVILTRPWVTRLLRRKGEPIPATGLSTSDNGQSCAAGCAHEKSATPAERRAA